MLFTIQMASVVDRVSWLLLFSTGLLCSSCAQAVELSLTARAVTAALRDAAFKRDGKHDLLPPSKCAYAYLEYPEAHFVNDRVTIRLHLSARAGQEVRGQCIGPGEAFWASLSGTPYIENAVVGVKDVRIDQLDNPNYRVLLTAALQQGLLSALRYDVDKALQDALARDVNHYRLTLKRLAITNLRARDDVLRANVDFELSGDVFP